MFAFIPLTKVVSAEDLLRLKYLMEVENVSSRRFPAAEMQYELLSEWLSSDRMSQFE